MSKRRKHPRLKNKALYETPGRVVHVVIGTKDKIPYFTKGALARDLVRTMKQVAGEKGNRVYAYCVMPDHVHVLVEASPQCGIIDFVRIVKGRFVDHCRKMQFYRPSNRRLPRSPFQASFYDHILRKDEDILEVATYILANPLRKGITKKMGEYPFAGSLEYDL